MNFRNLTANFETYTQTLGSRSWSQGLAWKVLVTRHAYANYRRYTSNSIGVVINFKNLVTLACFG